MANQEQLDILREGAKAWNEWIEQNREVRVDLSGADLRETDLLHVNFGMADLSNVNLSNSNLIGANLGRATLHNANLHSAILQAANLGRANLTNANLCEACLRSASCSMANFSQVNLCSATLQRAELFRANLSNANFINANLHDADLREANLFGANLSNANLLLVQATNANFTKVEMTGACIHDWHINSETNFEGVNSDFIYRGYDLRQDNENLIRGCFDRKNFTNRLPVNSDQKFKDSEFEQWIKIQAEARQTIDLTFTSGIDWQAFFQALQGVREQYPDTGIGLQAIEEKGSAFVIHIKTNSDKDRAAIETKTKELYDTQLKLSRAEGKIEILQDMNQTLERLAARPITENKMEFNAPVGNAAVQSIGPVEATQNNISQATGPSNPWMIFLGWFQNGQAIIAIIALIIGAGSTYFIPKMFPNGFPSVNSEKETKPLPNHQQESQI